MLEAMACGTPVLATPVGAIPDIIKDGETGFILENNSRECIKENIFRVFNHPDLDKIIQAARNLVEKDFSFESSVQRYKKILDQIQRM
jgi:glycosyltransferase involved in cell wall biosynthesis